ncbi:hypothetical protein [Streptomyces coeruleorubidus]|uniref:hypothetical protein n=1 Tax=Streptomyces coeruleorubidus TaxID=116188 RepID=UPI00187383E3|nr:hypothetical protein [Streptomyces bellus]GGU07206.1 hypothetical protein GCM10010244_36690 [Streptomyces bellus]
MPHKHWDEYDPTERDDANRLGVLFETLINHLHDHPERDAFITTLAGALHAEFADRAAGVYPPAGHSYPRLEA